MHGMHGVLSTASMPKNCGMKGIHENNAKKKLVKLENEVKPSESKLVKIPN